MEIAAAVIGGLVLILLGVVVKQVSGINTEFRLLNGRFFAHVIEKGIHHSGFAQVREHLESVESKADVAHKRIDGIKGG